MFTASLAPLPSRLLSCTLADGELIPTWCTAHDLPWLRDLLIEASAFAARPQHELLRRCRASDPDPRAGRKLAVARTVLMRLLRRDRTRDPALGEGPRRRTPAPRTLRRELFAAATRHSRDQALTNVAANHGLSTTALHAMLFADLEHTRTLHWPTPPPTPSDLLLACNRALAQALLRSATSATLTLSGHSRTVLRTAWLLGAHFRVLRHATNTATLRWQPPPHETRAAHRLARLLPVLPWARRFELRARCRWLTHDGTFVVTSHDQLLPGPEPRAFDSQLEQRFAADVAVQAPEWELLREPVPLQRGEQLAFPDFLLRRRGDGEGDGGADGWWIELAGLRDAGALAGKVELLRREARYVLCVPARALPVDLRGHARVVAFARRVDVAAVLACVSVASVSLAASRSAPD